MTQINVSLNSSASQSAIAELTAKLGDLTPVMSAVGEYFLGETRDRFDREVDPSGKPWAKLASATVRDKARRQRSGQTRSGGSRARVNAQPNAILKSSFIMRDTINYKPSPFSVAVGTPTKYGIHHQFGAPRANIPARPFLGYNSEDLKEIEEIVNDALTIL